jgi:Ras-related GTP-binding protein C/D
MDVILMGTSKSGKTSIKKVVFEKMSPHETVFLESTGSIETFKLENLGYTPLLIRDYPPDYTLEKAPANELKFFSTCGVLVYVIDSQETSDEMYENFKEIIVDIINKNPKINVEVFMHKADGTYFAQSNNMNKLRVEVHNKLNSILNFLNLEISIGYHNTSIYDHSLFEAFSKIFQKIMPQNNILSNLLDTLSNACGFEKAYLFDVYNKIYIAIDSNPIEEQFYEICSDMIDVVLDMSGIYGENNNNTDQYFDESSFSLIKINNQSRGEGNRSQSLLYLRFIDVNLALISKINDDDFERQHLIDYNIKLFKEAVKEIFKI